MIYTQYAFRIKCDTPSDLLYIDNFIRIPGILKTGVSQTLFLAVEGRHCQFCEV